MLLALDISTSCIGVSLFDLEGNCHSLSCVKMNKKKDLWERRDFFLKEIEHITDVQFIAIEEPLQKFAGGRSNAQTIGKLNFFNGIVSDSVYNKYGVKPIHLNVNTIRATAFPGMIKKGSDKDAKTIVWEQVSALEPQINWTYGPRSGKLKDENFDMADSYAVGLCMLKMIEAQMEQ